MSAAGVGPLCFIKSSINTNIYQDILENYMLTRISFLGFVFLDLTPVHIAKSKKSWLSNYKIIVFVWPINSLYVKSVENVWGTVNRKPNRKRPNNKKEINSMFEAWNSSNIPCLNVSIIFEICHKPLASMPRWITAVNRTKWTIPSVKYKRRILLWGLTFLDLKSFSLLVWIRVFRVFEFEVFCSCKY